MTLPAPAPEVLAREAWYERFLAAPTADWTDPALPRRGGARRLFDGPLAEHSRRQALGILSGLFNYLVAAGYLAGNPLALRRERGTRASRTRRVERYLDHALWQVVLDSVETWPQATARERQQYERSRWIVRLLYHTALPASEAAHEGVRLRSTARSLVAACDRQGRRRGRSPSERCADD